MQNIKFILDLCVGVCIKLFTIVSHVVYDSGFFNHPDILKKVCENPCSDHMSIYHVQTKTKVVHWKLDTYIIVRWNDEKTEKCRIKQTILFGLY